MIGHKSTDGIKVAAAQVRTRTRDVWLEMSSRSGSCSSSESFIQTQMPHGRDAGRVELSSLHSSQW